jgi:hypothetical protein
MERLVGPLAYLRVSHPTKALIDFIIPIILALIVFLVRFSSSETTGLLTEDGLLRLSIPLLGALSGFYIAALTAISAFPIASLDREMPGDRLGLLGANTERNPTRRKFLSMMFGYLAFLSISLFLVCMFAIYLKSAISGAKEIEISGISFGECIPWIGLFAFLFMLFNLVSVTLLSIYYLSDRIHREELSLEGGPEPKIR